MHLAAPEGYRDWPLLVDQIGFLEEIHPSLLNPDSFVNQLVCRVSGVDIGTTLSRVKEIARFTPALNLTCRRGDSGWEVGMTHTDNPIPVIDVGGYRSEDRRVLVRRVAAELAAAVRLDGPGARLAVVRLADMDSVVVLAAHHFTTDAYSLQRLRRAITSAGARLTGDDYDAPAQALARLAHSPAVRQHCLQRWTTLPWHRFARLPGRNSAAPELAGAPADVLAIRFDTPPDVSAALANAAPQQIRRMVLELAAKTFCRQFGGAVAAAVVHHGRDLGLSMRSSPDLMPLKLIKAIGWFTITGLSILSPDGLSPDDDQFLQCSWGLLQRISEREVIAAIISQFGPPGLWINVVRGLEAPTSVADARTPDSARRRALNHEIPLGAATDVMFKGIPLALQVEVGPHRTNADLTWDSGLFEDQTVEELSARWSLACREFAGRSR